MVTIYCNKSNVKVSLLREVRVTGTQACDTVTAALVTKIPSKWLTNRWGASTVGRLWAEGWVMFPEEGKEQDGERFHHDTQSSVQIKTYELSISKIFHLLISKGHWLRVTETTWQNLGWGGYGMVEAQRVLKMSRSVRLLLPVSNISSFTANAHLHDFYDK